MGRGKGVERIRNLFLLLVLILFVASFLFPPTTVNSMADWFIKLLIYPAILAFLAGSLIEAVSGGTFKRYLINIKVWRFRFSITIFAIAVLILRLVMF